MKKLSMMLCLLLVAATLAACATYSLPITATGMEIKSGMKTGEAIAVTYFGIWGDMSGCNIAAAARAGNISRIATVDLKVNNFLFIIQTHTCVVTGE